MAEDDRLASILARYMRARDRGEPMSREQVLQDHPEFRAELAAHFADEDRIDSLTAADLAPGTTVGPYEIEREVARGGMGVVFRARHKQLGRGVALKMIRVDHPDRAELLERFRVEAAAAAQLEHPGLVPIYEFGDHEGRPWFAMPFVAGGTLRSRRNEFAGDWQRIASIVAAVAEAVHFGHERGVIHRDLKPGNILLDADARPLVADFGLAKRLESDDRTLTRASELLGTPAYMAPELIARGATASTVASDIWALGVLLYELAAGRPPFEGATVAETIRLVERDEPRPLRASATPRDLETICLKCLEKDPGRRYATAQALADDLGRFQRHESIVARRPGAARRLFLFAQRRTAWLVAGATVAAGLVALALFLLERGAAERTAVVRSLLDRAREAAERADPIRAGLFYTAAHRVRPSPVSELGVRAHHVEPPEQILDPGAGKIRRLAFLDDERLLVVTEGGRVGIFAWRTGAERVLREAGTALFGLAVFPDRSGFVTAGAAGKLELWDVEAGLVRAAPVATPVDFGYAEIARDGVRVLASGHDPHVHVWNLESDAVAAIAFGHGADHVHALAASPADARVLVGAFAPGERSLARFLDLDTGRFDGPLSGHVGPMWRARFLDGGKHVVTCDNRAIRVFDRDGNALPPVMRQRTPVGALCRGPEGTLLCGSDRLVRRWDTATRQPVGAGLPDPGKVFAVAASPDGRWVAAGGTDTRVRIWPMPDARTTRLGFVYGPDVANAYWSTDGRRLLLQSKKPRGNRFVLVDVARLAVAVERPVESVPAVIGVWRGGWVLDFDGRTITWASGDLDRTERIALPPGAKNPVPVADRLFLRDDDDVVRELVLEPRVVGRGAVMTLSSNGRYLGLWRRDGTVEVRDLERNETVGVRALHGALAITAVTDDARCCILPVNEGYLLWRTDVDTVAPIPETNFVFALPGRSDLIAARDENRADLHFRHVDTMTPVGPALVPWGAQLPDADRGEGLVLGTWAASPDGSRLLVAYRGLQALHVWRLDRLGLSATGTLDGEREALRASLVAAQRVRDDGTVEDLPLAEWRRLRARYRR